LSFRFVGVPVEIGTRRLPNIIKIVMGLSPTTLVTTDPVTPTLSSMVTYEVVQYKVVSSTVPIECCAVDTPVVITDNAITRIILSLL
jgi:hypothetical protein